MAAVAQGREADAGYVGIPGVRECRVRVGDAEARAVAYMRWPVADVAAAGGRENRPEAQERRSVDAEWTCPDYLPAELAPPGQ
ncbi:MAG: hypothetical protein HY778_02125 [Betaproteobacteria bacterium]|nr:hypothetical protein [Betaproteobacteria bacterium]